MTKLPNIHDQFLLTLLSQYKQRKEPISINFRESIHQIKNSDRATHFIHKYPAKLLQHIPHFLLNNDILSHKNDLVFDPFMGSGTVPLETILSGRKAIGTDINPLAALISRVKTTSYNPEELVKTFVDILQRFRNNKKRVFGNPNVINLEHWYNQKSINSLMKLKYTINEIKDIKTREFFQLSFSTCLRKFSFADPRISVPVKINISKFTEGHWLQKHAQDHLNFMENNDVLSFFEDVVNKNIKRCEDLNRRLKENYNTKPKAAILDYDIRSIPNSILEENSVQLIITSPPYVSAQKYIRSSRLNIEWLTLGEEPTKFYDKKSIGREHIAKEEITLLVPTEIKSLDSIIKKIHKKNPTRAYITQSYMLEMKDTFKYLYKVVKNNGYFVMVIGNNTIAGYEFETQKFLVEIAENLGFSTELVLIDDIKSRGLMTKRNKTASTISREYVVIFKKKQ